MMKGGHSEHLSAIAAGPNGVKRMRDLVLHLAITGRLVEPCSKVEQANELSMRFQSIKLTQSKQLDGRRVRANCGRDNPSHQFRLPNTWQWLRLGQICSKITGGVHSSPKIVNDGMPLISAKNITAKGIDFEDTQSVTAVHGAALRQWCNPEIGDILLTARGTIGRCAMVSTSRTFCLRGNVILLKPNSVISVRYLFYFLATRLAQEWLRRASSTTAISALYVRDVKNCSVPVPPFAEQERIVLAVDKLMELCDLLEGQVSNAAAAHSVLVRELLKGLVLCNDAFEFLSKWESLKKNFALIFVTEQSIDALKLALAELAVTGRLVSQDPSDEPASQLLDRFRRAKRCQVSGGERLSYPRNLKAPFLPPSGWCWTKFDEVVSLSSGVRLDSQKTCRKNTVSMPYLRVANVQRGYLVLDEIRFVDVIPANFERYLLHYNDLLLAEGGDADNVGRTAIWRAEVKDCIHQNHIFRARAVLGELNVSWAELYLNSQIARAYFKASLNQTTKLASISLNRLGLCPFLLPPAAEQVRIVTKFGQLMEFCDGLKDALSRAHSKQVLLGESLFAMVAHNNE